MGWFWQRATQSDGTPLPARILTASGRRIDLTDRRTMGSLARTRMGWQRDAWNYRDLVGELAGSLRFRANAMSKVALTVGQVQDGDDQPIGVDSDKCTLAPQVKKAAQAALDRLPWRDGYGFLGRLDTSFSVAGEAWLHCRVEKGVERWQILSIQEIESTGDQMTEVGAPGQQGRVIDPQTEALIRLWVPHPGYRHLADSPLRSCADTLEDIVLTGREIRAASRSRIAANGVLFVTSNMALVRRTSNADDPADFQTELDAAMLAPIANEGDAGSVVPIVIEGDAEDIKAVRHLTLERETAADLGAKLDRFLTRMAESIDVPPTVVSGLQDTNHWNAYVITSETFRNHLEPGVRLMVDSLTEGYLRPSLTMPSTEGGWGLTTEEADQVVVWYDASKVTENPNRAADAKDAYDRFVIGAKALRENTGFSEDDQPTDKELLLMLASKVSVDPATAGQLIAQVVKSINPPVVVPVPEPGNQPDTTPVPARQPEVEPPVTPNRPPGLTAASGPALRIISADRLATIDTLLLERFMVAAEDAVARALEKANARVRSAAQGKLERSQLAAHTELAAYLGQARVSELGLTEDILLSAAFVGLAETFTAWSTQAIRQAVKAAASMVGLPLTAVAELTRTMTARIPHAWNRLAHALHARAITALFGRTGTERRGENPDAVVKAGDIRTALAEIGGTPPGGVAEGGASDHPLGGIGLGADIVALVSRTAGPPIGIMWVYGTDPRDTFEPHLRLDDHRFDGPHDRRLVPPVGYEWLGTHMHPGDHGGCRCHTVPAWIFPENSSAMDPELRAELAAAVADETPAMRNIRMLAQIDDAAGRHDTTAQLQRDERDRIMRLRAEWLDAA